MSHYLAGISSIDARLQLTSQMSWTLNINFGFGIHTFNQWVMSQYQMFTIITTKGGICHVKL